MRRRRRSFGLLDLVYLAIVLGLLVGASLWLDRRGVVVNARVEGKRERIVVLHEPSGDWDRYYDIDAGFRGADGSHWQASVTVPRERYDALHAGDAIEVRYLAELPFLARTTDRSTASIAWELSRKIAAVPLFVWLGAGLVALWIAARLGTVTSAVVGAAWTYSAFPLLFSTPSPVQAAGADGVARVAGITSISKSPSTTPHSHRSAGGGSAALRRLKVPYQVVQLAIPSNGGRDTVLAVDAVDSGSVAGLAFGALLPVRVDPSAPREARLADATRRFVDANRYHMIVPVVGLGILGTLGAMSYGWRRRRRGVRPECLRRQPSAAHLVASLLWLAMAPGGAWIAVVGLLVNPVPVQAALQAAPLPPLPQSAFPLSCRGGAGLLLETFGPPADSGTLARRSLTFAANPVAAGPEGEGLKPGTCAWVDRPVNDKEPRQVRVAIGSADSTLRRTITDSGVYWSFLAHNSDSGHFTGAGFRYWDRTWSPESAGHLPPAAVSARKTWLPFDPRYLPLVGIGWFVITWAPFTTLVGLWSGWRRLAGLYPDRNSGRVRSFRSSPMVMGMVNYRGGVRLTADEAHLHFSMSAFFRPGHPPFSVPWSDVAASRDEWPWFPLKGVPFVRLSLAKYASRRILVPLADGQRIVAASGGRLDLGASPQPSPRPAAAVGLDRR